MINQKQMQLIQKLLEKTRKQEIHWKETETVEEFQISFPSSSVRISGSGEKIVLGIFNEEGTIIDVIRENELFTQETNQSLIELLHLARRDALNADKILDKIIASLK